MIIDSPAFENHQSIPARYTCDGEDISPELRISGTPQGTKSLALVVDDPDAPMGTFDHWIVWNIDPSISSINEATQPGTGGLNDFRDTKYRGPCPPRGKPHRYFFKLYALDTSLNIPEGSTKESLEEAMYGHILGKGELVGTYQRQ